MGTFKDKLLKDKIKHLKEGQGSVELGKYRGFVEHSKFSTSVSYCKFDCMYCRLEEHLKVRFFLKHVLKCFLKFYLFCFCRNWGVMIKNSTI